MSAVAFDVESVRRRFSSLRSGLAFFDGPGGTQVPDEVIDAIDGHLRESNAPTLRPAKHVDLVAEGKNLQLQGRPGLEAGAESDQEGKE